MKKKHILGLMLAVLMLFNVFPTAGATAENISESDEDLVLVDELGDDLITIEPEEDEVIFVEDPDSLVKEEFTVFEQGYVLLPAGSFVFKSADGLEKLGSFAEDAVVYAVVSDRAENEADSWLEIRFDTDAAKEADEEYLVAYVQFGEVTVLDAAETEELLKELNEDLTTRSFEDHLLPLVEFVPGEETAELLPVEEDEVVAASAITITSQPKSAAVLDGTKVTFSVEAVGTGALSYVWQYKNPGGSWKKYGSTNQSITVTASAARDGRQHRVIITDEAGNTATSAAATLTIVPIQIISQPQSVSAFDGTKVTFSVEAIGTSALSYVWQYKNPGGSWKNYGSTNQSITVTASATRDGRQHRVIITDEAGNTVTSEAATLSVVYIMITSQPESVTAFNGTKVTFSVEAQGVGELSYVWQYRNPGGSWKNYGSTQQSITVTASATRNGRQHRVIVTDEAGNTVTSEPATLTVEMIRIISQPQSVSAVEGTKVTFSVEAEGVGELSYVWQYKNPGGDWKNYGSTQQSITVTASATRDGRQHRVIVTDEDGNTITSEPATLTLSPLGITSQPQSVTAFVGTVVTFSVEAKGVGTLSYVWQYKNPGGEWKNYGSTKSSIAVTAAAVRSGRQHRVIVRDSAGNEVISEAATLTVEMIRIIEQPQSATVVTGTKVTFSVEAEGASALSYVWQYKNPGGEWKNYGSTKQSITVTAAAARDGRQHRVIIRDADGNELISEFATLTVISEFVLGDVTYQAITSTTCRVLSYSGSDASLVIPETVQGMTVVEIGEEAFMNNTTLVSIDLPDTITVIQARAFKGCTNLAQMG